MTEDTNEQKQPHLSSPELGEQSIDKDESINEEERCRVLYTLSDSYIPDDDNDDLSLIGLESQQELLRNNLERCLFQKMNGWCLLVGPRGHGKRTLLRYVLKQLQREHVKHCHERSNQKLFRVVKLSGLMMNSDDSAAVREAAAQLTVEHDVSNTYYATPAQSSVADIKSAEKGRLMCNEYSDDEGSAGSLDDIPLHNSLTGKVNSNVFMHSTDCGNQNDMRSPGENIEKNPKLSNTMLKSNEINAVYEEMQEESSNENSVMDTTRYNQNPFIDYNMRIIPCSRRSSSFHSNLSIITDAMKRSKVEGVPILIVLEDLELFAQQANFRQVLLYHLLDKVGAPDTLVFVVGMTCRQTISHMFEKRIRSRSGSQITIYFPRYSFDSLQQILLKKLNGAYNMYEEKPSSSKLVKTLSDLIENCALIKRLFSRCLSLGRNIRWFTGILTKAIVSLDDYKMESIESTIIMSLTSCGADLSAYSSEIKRDKKVLNGDRRIKSLYQLSGIELALLLTAKRIMSRDIESVSNSKADTTLSVLTFNKIFREHRTFVTRQSLGVSNFDKGSMLRAFAKLINSEILRIASAGTEPIRHHYNIIRHYPSLEWLQFTPVFLCLDIKSELHYALYENHLECNTALREWALKQN